MNNPPQSSPEYLSQQPQAKTNKTLVIALSIVIGVLLLLGSCGAGVMYLNAQKAVEEARTAKEKAEEEKRVLQRIKEDGERKAEAERLERAEAARREEEERLRREEQERLEREEQERLKREAEANKAHGQVISVNKVADWEFVNGEADAGYKVSAIIKNVGVSGDLQVVTFLSCSQGRMEPHSAFVL